VVHDDTTRLDARNIADNFHVVLTTSTNALHGGTLTW
jgi:hypothetical protein